MQDSARLLALIKVHHVPLAIGSTAKGFPALAARNEQPRGQWPELFYDATQAILRSLKALGNFLVVREAALAAFKLIVASTGALVLPLVPELIDILASQMKATELVDFLPFLAMLLNKHPVRLRLYPGQFFLLTSTSFRF